MPPVIPFILECISMACAPRISTRLIGKWIVRLVGEWPKWLIAYQYTIRIAAELCARRTILEVIFSIVFIYPGAFNKRVQECIVKVFAEALPSVLLLVKLHHLFSFPDGFESLTVYFYSVERID